MRLDIFADKLGLPSLSLIEMGVTRERKIMFQQETVAHPCGSSPDHCL